MVKQAKENIEFDKSTEEVMEYDGGSNTP